MGGVSVAGFRPGFGRGGIIHSLVVRDGGLGGVAAAGEVGVDEGWRVADGKSEGVRAAGASTWEDVVAIMQVAVCLF